MLQLAHTNIQLPVSHSRTLSLPRALSFSPPYTQHRPTLPYLPPELAFHILEEACLHNPRSILSLARTCRTISAIVRTALYRTVVLEHPHQLSFFARSLTSRGVPGLAHPSTLIRTLAINLPNQFKTIVPKKLAADLDIILTICSDASKIYLSTGAHQVSRHIPSLLPSEMTFQTYLVPSIGTPSGSVTTCTTPPTMTHLRIISPLDRWVSPLQFFASNGLNYSHLTHLALPRMINANVINDQIFVDDLREILETSERLQVLVVVVVDPLSGPEDRVVDFESESEVRENSESGDNNSPYDQSLLSTLAPLAKLDPRLVAIRSPPGAWSRECEWLSEGMKLCRGPSLMAAASGKTGSRLDHGMKKWVTNGFWDNAERSVRMESRSRLGLW